MVGYRVRFNHYRYKQSILTRTDMTTARTDQEVLPVVPRTVKFFAVSVGGPPHGIARPYDISEPLIDIGNLEFLPVPVGIPVIWTLELVQCCSHRLTV